MASLFGGASTNSQATPVYTQVQLQTSAEGVGLTVVWGANRVAPNLVWIDNFKQHQSSGKKGGGKGGSKGSASYTYTCAMILAICEGPVSLIGNIYVDGSVSNTAALNLGAYTGTADQMPWPATASPGYVPIAYRNVCYVAANDYDLGSSAVVPQHAMEIYGFRAGTSAPDRPDVNPADIIVDLWTDSRYGLGMPANMLGDMTQFHNYCTVLVILLSPVLSNQEQAISILQRWAQLSNTWIFWSENKLKFVPLGDALLISNGATYTPVTTIQYDLTYDDFIADQNTPPLTITRSDPSDAYNWVKVNISDRGNQYSTAVIEYKDQTSIQKYGLLQANEIQANEVCDRSIGAVIAGLIGQRAVYIRNVYAFKLSYNFVLLEPGDIVSLTDPAIGLVRHPVRIRTIDEDNTGNLSITAEECPSGTGTAAVVGTQPSQTVGFPSVDVDPGSVNAPTIIEPPASVTSGVAQVWIGLSGASQYWGGADVWISADDVTYVQAGQVTQATPQGVLLAVLPLHADPDTADTLKIDFSESRQTLSSAVTSADADASRTLVMVNGEVMGFGAVIPDATNSFSYDLTYLRRGVYNTGIAAAAVGDPAAVLNQASMLQVSLPESYVGKTIYLKFTSFNLFGSAPQDISTVTRYSYTPIGVVYTIAPPSAPSLAVTTPSGATVISMTLSWAASAGPALGSYEAQMSVDGGSTWAAADITLGASASSFTLTAATPAANYQGRVRAVSSNGSAVSSWVTSSIVNAGAGPAIPGSSASLTLVNGDIPAGFVVNDDGVPIQVPQ